MGDSNKILGRIKDNKTLDKKDNLDLTPLNVRFVSRDKIQQKDEREVCYNPFNVKFYTQKIIFFDEDLGWIFQLDLILMWIFMLTSLILYFLL